MQDVSMSEAPKPRLAPLGSEGHVGTSQETIRAHNDISNAFYRLWLDESLTYSCPFWSAESADDSLYAAQIRKLDAHAVWAQAVGAPRVLDIGCACCWGWGALLQRLVRVHGVKQAVGRTPSEAQAEWIRAQRLPDCQVHVAHWQDHYPEQFYDTIICIEALEHFARAGQGRDEKVRAYRAFFSKCRSMLRADGMLSLQATFYETLTRLERFITSRIWPESDLPRLSELMQGADRIFEVVRIENRRDDYARALAEWASRLSERRKHATSVTSDDETGDYLRYLRMSAKAFRTGAFSMQYILFRALPAL